MEEYTARRSDSESFENFRIKERERDHFFQLLNVRTESSNRIERDRRRHSEGSVSARARHGKRVRSSPSHELDEKGRRLTCNATDFAEVVGSSCTKFHPSARSQHSTSTYSTRFRSEESRFRRRTEIWHIIVGLRRQKRAKVSELHSAGRARQNVQNQMVDLRQGRELPTALQ